MKAEFLPDPDDPLTPAPRVRPFFEAAGWFPERRRPIPDEVPTDHPAATILACFGSLKVEAPGPYTAYSRPGVDFGFDADCLELHEIHDWNERLQTILIPIGNHINFYEDFYVDSSGRWFSAPTVCEGFWFVGETFREAMNAIFLLGRSDYRPLIPPDAETVDWYGRPIGRDHPAVYPW